MLNKDWLRSLSDNLLEQAANGGIKAKDIPGLIGECTRSSIGEFNCYPGNQGKICYETAFFISLKASPYAKGREHLSCRQAFEKLIQHVYGHCSDLEDLELIIITANWNSKAFDEWRVVLNELSDIPAITIRYYLLAGNGLSPIKSI